MKFPLPVSSVLLRLLLLLCGALPLAGAAQQSQPYLLWPQPDRIQYLSPLTQVQLNARAFAGPPQPVPLRANYNVSGIATAGSPFNGGLDGNGESFSSASLASQLTWQGVTFTLGPADAPDVVSGGTVLLPTGAYSRLLVLADLVNDVYPGTGTFTVHYSSGDPTTSTQAFSDWVRPRNNPGEATVQCVPNRIFYDGSVEPNSTCVYGYELALDPSRTALSVDLPANRNIVVLAMSLLPPQLAGTIAYTPSAGTYPPVGTTSLQAAFTPADTSSPGIQGTVPLLVSAPSTPLATAVTWATPSPVSVGTRLGPAQLNATASAAASIVPVSLADAVRVNAFYHDGAAYRETGFDGQNAAYSFDQLGNTLQYQGAAFALGYPDVQNAASSDTIQVPAGNYSELYLLGAASRDAAGQVFTLHYSDGTSAAQTLDLSAWTATTTHADETVVSTTTALDLADGSQRTATARVYGYTLQVDNTRTLQSLLLPPNPAVVILAAGLRTGARVPVPGSMAYTPPAGTPLAIGSTNLHVDFTPDDPSTFAKAQGSVVITALRPALSATANSATRAYAAPNPAFTGSLSGAIGADQFTESFSTAATPDSPPGSYAIVPSVAGTNVSGYDVTLSPGVLTVTRAASTATLKSVQAGPSDGAVSVAILVAPTTAGVPTGTVTLLANGIVVGSAPLVQGSATIASQPLPAGQNSLAASYSGDVDFLPSTSETASLLISFRDFLITAPRGNDLTGTVGSSPSLSFHIAPLEGTYANDASFSVSGDLPIGTVATFSPASLPMNGGPQDVTVTLHTRKLALLENPLSRPSPLLAFAFICTFTPLVLRRQRCPKPVRLLLALMLASGFTWTMQGCGTGYAAHDYAFNVVAKTGPVSHSIPLTLHIQASEQ